MNNPNSTNSQEPTGPAAPQDVMGFSPWQWLKSKRISYLTLPLIAMATVVEFVILATGWKYQQVVCVPQGMGVLFFGIGPIGATILAVELLKLPLAIWTASRQGGQKTFMLIVGLPLICVLTFQLVKDMAVYEMTTAMKPASEFLQKAATEDIKIAQLNGELEVIEQKKTDRERKLADLTMRQTKIKADLEESLKHNEGTRKDAVTLTEYQQKELTEVEARQANIIKQFDADTAQLTKAIADLRARREIEVGRASRWNAEEARIDNAYKPKLADYMNKKAAYEKDKAEYENAHFVVRKLMREPVDPGVPPVRESNVVLKPIEISEIDAQLKAKEAELLAVNNKRRERVAQVDADARRVREEFDRRSGIRRQETDRKREELLAAQAKLAAEWAAQAKEADQELAVAVQKVDGFRAQIDAHRKKAEEFYEAREAAIRNTQVHRIATTVEIVRGLFMGERPMSIKATAKERGDILTDQISMVRIWVYPVFAFIIAFLPTLMVEIGFSTVFQPEQQRPAHRLGFFGRRLHWLYTRAGRQKILRAERMASEASNEVVIREKALAAAKAATAAQEEQLKQREREWEAQFAGVTDSLKQALVEKDALRDFQQSEIERQVQLRQNVWSDRLAEMSKRLEDQHAAHEAERATVAQEHHKKLTEVSEDCRSQVMQLRRQMADATLAAEETSAKQALETKEALDARELACSQLQLQVEALSLKLTQAKEEAARENEKIARQEKHRLERQQMEFSKTLRQRNEELEHQLKLREQELSLESDTRVAQEQARIERDAREREEKFEHQLETRVHEVEARWNQELQQREEAAQVRLRQREQQMQAQAEARLREMQTQAEEQLHRLESELERQRDAKSREAETRLREELQQKELTYLARLKQREAELTDRAAVRETELKKQWASELRARDEEWEREAQSRVHATETRLGHETQQKEELFQSQSLQRDQQWQVKLDAVRAELQAQNDQVLRRRETEAEARLRTLETDLRKEMLQKDDASRAEAKQREQDLIAQLTAQAEAQKMAAQQWEAESEKRMRAGLEPLKELLARAEKERDAAVSQVQSLESRLTEVSSFLNGWKNGKPTDAPRSGKNAPEVAAELGTNELWSQSDSPERNKQSY
jgi:hypothetical protein